MGVLEIDIGSAGNTESSPRWSRLSALYIKPHRRTKANTKLRNSHRHAETRAVNTLRQSSLPFQSSFHAIKLWTGTPSLFDREAGLHNPNLGLNSRLFRDVGICTAVLPVSLYQTLGMIIGPRNSTLRTHRAKPFEWI